MPSISFLGSVVTSFIHVVAWLLLGVVLEFSVRKTLVLLILAVVVLLLLLLYKDTQVAEEQWALTSRKRVARVFFVSGLNCELHHQSSLLDFFLCLPFRSFCEERDYQRSVLSTSCLSLLDFWGSFLQPCVLVVGLTIRLPLADTEREIGEVVVFDW